MLRPAQLPLDSLQMFGEARTQIVVQQQCCIQQICAGGVRATEP